MFEAPFGGAKVRAVLTGMGQEHALRSVKKALTYRPDICISTGLAGSLRDDHRPGDVLAARLVGEAGEPVAVASHRELLATAVECGARQIERLATSKTLVTRADRKRQLAVEAEAVEMESYTILAEASRCGVPAIAVRAVSDAVDFDMPYDFERARDNEGQIRTTGIVLQVFRKPSGVPSLLKLARNTNLASRRLAAFLDAFMGTMADRLIPSIEHDVVEAL